MQAGHLKNFKAVKFGGTRSDAKEAVDRGAGDGWLDVLPMSTCPSPLDENVVVDASPLVTGKPRFEDLEKSILHKVRSNSQPACHLLWDYQKAKLSLCSRNSWEFLFVKAGKEALDFSLLRFLSFLQLVKMRIRMVKAMTFNCLCRCLSFLTDFTIFDMLKLVASIYLTRGLPR